MKKVKIITSTLLAASMLAACSPEQETDTSSKLSKADTGYEEKRVLSQDYEGKCGECREIIADDYKYCTYCGTKAGEGSFEPYENLNACVYGAPRDYKLVCPECGYTDEGSAMTGDIPGYCPYCGTEAEVTEENPLADSEE